MRILGIDPSLRAYGWAIHDSTASGQNRRIASGHEGTLPSTVPVARFMHFQALVRKLIDKYSPEAVGIESPAFSSGVFQTVHYGLMLFSLVPIFESRIDCVLYDPATLKMLAKGDPKKHGVMYKLDMQRKVQSDTLDCDIIDNNEADAYLIALFTGRLLEFISGVIPVDSLTESEKRVFLLKTKKVKTLLGTRIKRIGHVFRENNRFFEFSKIPHGSVTLPDKSEIRPDIIEFLESLDSE